MDRVAAAGAEPVGPGGGGRLFLYPQGSVFVLSSASETPVTHMRLLYVVPLGTEAPYIFPVWAILDNFSSKFKLTQLTLLSFQYAMHFPFLFLCFSVLEH